MVIFRPVAGLHRVLVFVEALIFRERVKDVAAHGTAHEARDLVAGQI